MYFTLDVEASSLEPDSFPFAVGWCDDRGVSHQLLISPPLHWNLGSWDEQAEKFHGFELYKLLSVGESVSVVANALNSELSGKTVLSDGLAFDADWVGMIFEAAGFRQDFRLLDIYQWLGGTAKEHSIPYSDLVRRITEYEDSNERRHLAEEDALFLHRMIEYALDGVRRE